MAVRQCIVRKSNSMPYATSQVTSTGSCSPRHASATTPLCYQSVLMRHAPAITQATNDFTRPLSSLRSAWLKRPNHFFQCHTLCTFSSHTHYCLSPKVQPLSFSHPSTSAFVLLRASACKRRLLTCPLRSVSLSCLLCSRASPHAGVPPSKLPRCIFQSCPLSLRCSSRRRCL